MHHPKRKSSALIGRRSSQAPPKDVVGGVPDLLQFTTKSVSAARPAPAPEPEPAAPPPPPPVQPVIAPAPPEPIVVHGEPAAQITRLARIGRAIRLGLRFIRSARNAPRATSAPAFADFWDIKPTLAPTRRKLNKFIFEAATDLSVIVDGQEVIHEYCTQVDPNMYTTEALAVRERLRHDPVVVRVAREFWSTFGKAFSESRDDDQRLLNRLTYVDFHMRLVRALYPPDALTDEASRRLAVDDWASDSRGATRMNFKEFRAALYEIADLWTPSLDASDYVYFLKVLFCRMAFRSQVARVNGLLRRPDTRFQWKPLPQVSNATPFEDYFDVESLDGASTRSDSKRNSLIDRGAAPSPPPAADAKRRRGSILKRPVDRPAYTGPPSPPARSPSPPTSTRARPAAPKRPPKVLSFMAPPKQRVKAAPLPPPVFEDDEAASDTPTTTTTTTTTPRGKRPPSKRTVSTSPARRQRRRRRTDRSLSAMLDSIVRDVGGWAASGAGPAATTSPAPFEDSIAGRYPTNERTSSMSSTTTWVSRTLTETTTTAPEATRRSRHGAAIDEFRRRGAPALSDDERDSDDEEDGAAAGPAGTRSLTLDERHKRAMREAPEWRRRRPSMSAASGDDDGASLGAGASSRRTQASERRRQQMVAPSSDGSEFKPVYKKDPVAAAVANVDDYGHVVKQPDRIVESVDEDRRVRDVAGNDDEQAAGSVSSAAARSQRWATEAPHRHVPTTDPLGPPPVGARPAGSQAPPQATTDENDEDVGVVVDAQQRVDDAIAAEASAESAAVVDALAMRLATSPRLDGPVSGDRVRALCERAVTLSAQFLPDLTGPALVDALFSRMEQILPERAVPETPAPTSSARTATDLVNELYKRMANQQWHPSVPVDSLADSATSYAPGAAADWADGGAVTVRAPAINVLVTTTVAPPAPSSSASPVPTASTATAPAASSTSANPPATFAATVEPVRPAPSEEPVALDRPVPPAEERPQSQRAGRGHWAPRDPVPAPPASAAPDGRSRPGSASTQQQPTPSRPDEPQPPPSPPSPRRRQRRPATRRPRAVSNAAVSPMRISIVPGLRRSHPSVDLLQHPSTTGAASAADEGVPSSSWFRAQGVRLGTGHPAGPLRITPRPPTRPNASPRYERQRHRAVSHPSLSTALAVTPAVAQRAQGATFEHDDDDEATIDDLWAVHREQQRDRRARRPDADTAQPGAAASNVPEDVLMTELAEQLSSSSLAPLSLDVGQPRKAVLDALLRPLLASRKSLTTLPQSRSCDHLSVVSGSLGFLSSPKTYRQRPSSAQAMRPTPVLDVAHKRERSSSPARRLEPPRPVHAIAVGASSHVGDSSPPDEAIGPGIAITGVVGPGHVAACPDGAVPHPVTVVAQHCHNAPAAASLETSLTITPALPGWCRRRPSSAPARSVPAPVQDEDLHRLPEQEGGDDDDDADIDRLASCLTVTTVLGAAPPGPGAIKGAPLYLPVHRPEGERIRTPLPPASPSGSARDPHLVQILRRALGKGSHSCRPVSARSHVRAHRDRSLAGGRHWAPPGQASGPEALLTDPGSQASLDCQIDDRGRAICRLRAWTPVPCFASRPCDDAARAPSPPTGSASVRLLHF
ncbi:EF-hand domain-containing protein [Plasmodiophora brassicae]